MKILITGASGFTGKYMVEYLADKNDIELFGLSCKTRKKSPDTIEWIQCDIRNAVETECTIQNICPDRIIHLAGLNHGSFQDLINVNLFGTENILRALLKQNSHCRVLVTGSSAEYGDAGTKPIPESAPLKPVSEYGVSKVAEELLAKSFFLRFALPVTIVRPFNLIGPGQTSAFVCGRIISQVIEIKKGLRDSIELTEIDSKRDFIDVRDAVAAYWSIIDHPDFKTKCAGNIFNVGSGTSCSISDIIKTIREVTNDPCPVELSQKAIKNILPSQQSDITLIKKTTGWFPTVSLIESIKDMIACQ